MHSTPLGTLALRQACLFCYAVVTTQRRWCASHVGMNNVHLRRTLTPRHAALALLAGLALTPRLFAIDSSTDTNPPATPAHTTEANQKNTGSVTPRIQLAIVLDTSGSMDGLIDQARSQIWTVVNTLISLKQKGQQPTLEVALYQYGNDSIAASEQHVQMLVPFTTDLDDVSAKLFALTTNGGEEYCGAVIGKAVSGLSWSSCPDDLKIIMIAGNESFAQGKIDYKVTIPNATMQGITINTVFCGPKSEGEQTMWLDGARLGEGTYSAIETNAVAVHIDSPYDAQIVKLGSELNTTYVRYGTGGLAAAANQSRQDANAEMAAPAASIERAKTKASGAYRNETWDLVDALTSGARSAEEIAELPSDELPQELATLTPDERIAYVQKKADQRARMQKELTELTLKREAHVAEIRRTQSATSGGVTLESVLVTSIVEQGQKRGFTR
jgi:hypothetical protein